MAKIWAHRGASGYAPENTLEAFELAVKQRADGVELDVQLSKDGELAVIHDETVDRVSDGTGMVCDFTLAELKKFHVRGRFPEYENARIPTLREVYELLKDTDLTVNVELKTSIILYPGIEEKVLRETAEMGMEERVWYSSFNHFTLKKLKALDPGVRTGMLYADGLCDAAGYGKSLGVDALHPALYHLQYPDLAEGIRREKLKLHVWTVNEIPHIQAALAWGVDAVITDYPDRVRKVLDGASGE